MIEITQGTLLVVGWLCTWFLVISAATGRVCKWEAEEKRRVQDEQLFDKH